MRCDYGSFTNCQAICKCRSRNRIDTLPDDPRVEKGRTTMTKVFIRKATYAPEVLEPLIHSMLDSRGDGWISRGDRVLVKPNLLMPAAPEQAIVTHPEIVRIVAEYLLAKGAIVQVSDSPPIGNFHKIIRQSGYFKLLNDLGVDLKPLKQSIQVDIGEPFGAVEISRDSMEADKIINLAKLKSHVHMTLTLGVKNMFGAIVGLRKPEWHLRAGVDRNQFARLLVQVYQAVRPVFTIVDGITALEGQGPGRSGTPRELGLLIGGADAHAVDKTVCTLLGLDPEALLTVRLADRLGFFDGDVLVDGDLHIIDDFCFPELSSLSLGPDTLGRFMRNHLIQKPVVDNGLCKLCGECWKICPAKVIRHNDRSIQFDYDNCIRCYCCLEVCLHGAIKAKEPLLGRLHRRLTGQK
jgi:uncharacterized protein (DUF362 family)/Pyruvate/2-oxoacid:ferredoxin oxidoreductase delta subunit